MSDNILDPNMELIKSNDFYLLYEMMTQAMINEDIKDGLHASFELLRTFLQSSHISLYRKNETGQYVLKLCDLPMKDLLVPTSSIVNKSKSLSELKGIFSFNMNLCDQLNDIMLIHIKLESSEFIISITNYDKEKKLDTLFWERLRETMTIILKRAENYEKNIAAITTDLLTGLDNRNSYEIRLRNLKENDENLVFGIFDLFRLKYVNDHYGHNVGDDYIKNVANILKNYWRKNKAHINKDGTESFVDTGHCIYRVGGDEFVLLTTSDNLQFTSVKANLVSLEANNLVLVSGEQPHIGINYGIIQHHSGDSIKDTMAKADELMEKNKTKMYTDHGLERRI